MIKALRLLLPLGAALLIAAPAATVPPSLRSIDDIHELIDVFMRALVKGDVTNAYRGLGSYWPLPGEALAKRIASAQQGRSARRGRLGLSVGYEIVQQEPAGTRALRLTVFQRFDKGGVAWRLLFVKPANVWLLQDVEESEDLHRLFAAPSGLPSSS